MNDRSKHSSKKDIRVINIANQQNNENQNHNEISLHFN